MSTTPVARSMTAAAASRSGATVSSRTGAGVSTASRRALVVRSPWRPAKLSPCRWRSDACSGLRRRRASSPTETRTWPVGPGRVPRRPDRRAPRARRSSACDDGTGRGSWHGSPSSCSGRCPVLAPLTVSAEVERPGRMVSLVGASLSHGGGRRGGHGRARCGSAALRSSCRRTSSQSRRSASPASARGRADRCAATRTSRLPPGLRRAALRRRRVRQAAARSRCGAACVVPLFAGEEPTGAQRVDARRRLQQRRRRASSTQQSMLFINPDLTVHLLRHAGRRVDRAGRPVATTARRAPGMPSGALYDAGGSARPRRARAPARAR